MEKNKLQTFLIPALIVILIIGSTIFFIYRLRKSDQTQSTEPETTTTEPTPLITEEPTEELSPTEEEITETPTPTEEEEESVTEEPTPDTSELHSDWTYGLSSQKYSGSTYFISSDNKKKLMKGSSINDDSATTIYTSSNGNLQEFRVMSASSIIMVEGKGGTNESRIVNYYPSSGKTALIYKYITSAYEMNSFSINKNDYKKVYVALKSVTKSRQPRIMYLSNYEQKWIETFSDASTKQYLKLLGPNSDKSQLLLQVHTTASKYTATEFDL